MARVTKAEMLEDIQATARLFRLFTKRAGEWSPSFKHSELFETAELRLAQLSAKYGDYDASRRIEEKPGKKRPTRRGE